MTLHDAIPGRHGNVMPGLDANRCIHLDMGIDDDNVAHFARAHVVDTEHARCLPQRVENTPDLLIIDCPIHEVMQRIPTELPAHLGHHKSHDERCNWIQNRKTRQIANNADTDDDG